MPALPPPVPGLHRLERSQVLPRPRAEVFPFFADPSNLDAITPPFLRFRILTPPPRRMEEGARLEYRIRLGGIPLRWRTLIERFEPPRMFLDVQTSGPYRVWRHLHLFEEEAGGTRMTDVVDYALARVPLAGLVHRRFVAPRLARIFDFRRDRVAVLLAK